MTLKCLLLAEPQTGSALSAEIPMALESDWLSLAKRFHSEDRKEQLVWNTCLSYSLLTSLLILTSVL